MDARIWVPILGVIITGIFSVFVAYINRQNKPVRDILKNTRIKGDGSLIEAISVLQKQREKDQKIFDEQLEFYRNEVISARNEVRRCKTHIDYLERQVEELKDRLSQHDVQLKQDRQKARDYTKAENKARIDSER